jgi:hypothetical protein
MELTVADIDDAGPSGLVRGETTDPERAVEQASG